MTPLDRALAVAGKSHAVITRGGRAPRLGRFLVAVLIGLTVTTVLMIGLTPQPLEVSFDDLRQGNYPTRTSWLRLHGDLQGGEAYFHHLAYRLYSAEDPTIAVTVFASAPLPIGDQDVTGQPLGGPKLDGTFDAFYADVPAVPARRDPWLLIALPSAVALFLLVGARVGYPVIRSELPRGRSDRPLASGESVAARWSGQILGESLTLGLSRSCAVAVERDAGVSTVTVADATGARAIPVLHTSPRVIGRACRTGGCDPAIAFHGPGSDVVLEFDSADDRDRLSAAIR